MSGGSTGDMEKYFKDEPKKQTRISAWFDDLPDHQKSQIVEVTDEFGLGHPTEYSSASDVLIDVYRLM